MDDKDVKTFGQKIDALSAKVEKMLGLSRIEPADMTLKDKDGNEFTLEKEEGSPAVGDKASPDGTYMMTDGKKIVITDGAIASIDEEADTPDELDQAKEKISALEEEIKTLKAEAKDLTAKEAELDTLKDEATEIISELKALKNDWKPAGRSKFSSVDKVGDIDLGRVKEIIANKSKK